MTIIIVIIALSLLIFVHELGHFLVAKMVGMRVDEFGIGFPPKAFSFKYGETEYSLNLLPFGGFVRIHGEDPSEVEKEDAEPERSFSHQATWKQTLVIIAGVFMNAVFGWLLLSFVFMSGMPDRLVISEVVSNSPASEAELRMGDAIVGAVANGDRLEEPVNAERFISFVSEDGSREFLLTIMRGDEVFDVSVPGRANPPEGEGSMGVVLADVGVEARGFFSAVWDSFFVTVGLLGAIVVAFFDLIVGIFTTPGATEDLAGPVGIFMLAGDAASLGFVYLAQLTAIISLNLVVLNLIPFPALDGGRFLMIIAEKIKGSPISRNVQVGINAVGIVILLIFMVLITIQDIGKFL